MRFCVKGKSWSYEDWGYFFVSVRMCVVRLRYDGSEIVTILSDSSLERKKNLGPVYMKVGDPRWVRYPALVGNPPLHIISHFNLITFT